MESGKNEGGLFNFFTDGAYSPIRNQGGWAYYCPELHLRVCGEQTETTNNRMELMAVIKALEFIVDSNLTANEFILNTDSMYVIGGLFLDWQENTNLDLWKRVTDLLDEFVVQGKKLSYNHVKGHTGIYENELVDQLAVKMSQYGNN